MRRTWGFTILHIVAAVVIATPAVAADYSPWPGQFVERPQIELVTSKRGGGGDTCCKHCTKGQPCGNTCISVKDTCRTPPGCAC